MTFNLRFRYQVLPTFGAALSIKLIISSRSPSLSCNGTQCRNLIGKVLWQTTIAGERKWNRVKYVGISSSNHMRSLNSLCLRLSICYKRGDLDIFCIASLNFFSMSLFASSWPDEFTIHALSRTPSMKTGKMHTLLLVNMAMVRT